MTTYKIAGKVIESSDANFPKLLAESYGSKNRPICICISAGVEMYIAKISGKHVLKRMPNTGGLHFPTCDSYEPPAELSGLGQVIGSAIQEDPDSGNVALKLNFSLSKGGSKKAPSPSDNESDSVKTDGNKLTLRGTLHYLIEQAGFNKWSPFMHGKRNWGVFRKYLLEAAMDKQAKGSAFSELLYIPETFQVDRKDEIKNKRLMTTSRISGTTKGARKLMLVVGEIKEIASSPHGYRMVIKHLPDYNFMLNKDLHDRMVKRFSNELELKQSNQNISLIVIGTFSIGASGFASFEEICLQTLTENWIPFENAYEKDLIESLISADRRFSKCLRYNLKSSNPLASVVITDANPPVAIYVLPPGSTESYVDAMSELTSHSEMKSLIWKVGQETIPVFPPKSN